MELTQQYVKSLFDYKDGFLYWKVTRGSNAKAGERAGTIRNPKKDKERGYSPRNYVYIDGKNNISARIIFLWHHGYLPKMVDHKDRNGFNDKIENLRAADYSTNNKNKTSSIGSSSKYLGVSWITQKNKWCVHIRINGRSTYGGYFINENDAALRYNELAIVHYGEFANLNIIL